MIMVIVIIPKLIEGSRRWIHRCGINGRRFDCTLNTSETSLDNMRICLSSGSDSDSVSDDDNSESDNDSDKRQHVDLPE